MSIPFLLRGAYTLARIVADMDDIMDASIKSDTWLTPITMFWYVVIADIVPTTAQTSSMLVLFGDKDYAINASDETDLHTTSETQSLLSERDDTLLLTAKPIHKSDLDISSWDQR